MIRELEINPEQANELATELRHSFGKEFYIATTPCGVSIQSDFDFQGEAAIQVNIAINFFQHSAVFGQTVTDKIKKLIKDGLIKEATDILDRF